MTQETKPTIPTAALDSATSTTHRPEDARVGETVQPATDGLPDLSRLSLGNGDGGNHAARLGQANGGPARAGRDPAPGVQLHVNVYSHGGPVTVNVMPGANSGGPPGTETRRVTRTVRSPVGPVPPASPARIRLASPLPTGPAGQSTVAASAVAAPVAMEPQHPLSPLLQEHGSPTPPSPSLESVPATPTAPGTPPVAWDNSYEHIAPRDPGHTHWYVVTAGRRVGIWREWLDMADYVTSIPGNQHKGFKSRADAERHYYTNKALGNVQVIMP